MSDSRTLDRREFTLETALALLSGVAITISGCGGGSSPSGSTPPTGSTPAAGDRVGQISANHGHSAVIVAAQLAAGGGVNLDIRGNANHPHSVSLSAAEIVSVAANQRVSKESSNNDAHTVTFN